jgi:hypothetical protein
MTKRKDTEIVSLAAEAQLERLLYETCRKSGWLFAATERDVSDEEKRQTSGSIDVPDDIRDPNKVWQRARRLSESMTFKPVIDEGVTENLARAARGGASIPKEVEERMHRDRERAEKESGL